MNINSTVKNTIGLGILGMTCISAPAAFADDNDGVTASAAISNMYHWRGQDLGNGDPAISGDLQYTMQGAYAGIWGSSGDATNGNEYDLFAGYGIEMGGISIDASLWTYIYPDKNGAQDDNSGDLSEFILAIGAGPATFTIYDNIAGATGYYYYTLGLSMDAYGLTFGLADPKEPTGQTYDNDYMHLDLSYSYNDNLSFKLSKVIDVDDKNTSVDDDTNFVISYSIPLNK